GNWTGIVKVEVPSAFAVVRGFSSEVMLKGSSVEWVFGVATDAIFGSLEVLASFSMDATNGISHFYHRVLRIIREKEWNVPLKPTDRKGCSREWTDRVYCGAATRVCIIQTTILVELVNLEDYNIIFSRFST
nr:hypothetical protein [Tanacetum cinerariifolium]